MMATLAEHPAAGMLIAGTGGVRKLRWAREGMGKSGGVRVIYYFHSEHLPYWERGDREPHGPARVLLHVVSKQPKAVLSALSA
jgi:hypothetical protein